jgi:hypothetical protein
MSRELSISRSFRASSFVFGFADRARAGSKKIALSYRFGPIQLVGALRRDQPAVRKPGVDLSRDCGASDQHGTTDA